MCSACGSLSIALPFPKTCFLLVLKFNFIYTIELTRGKKNQLKNPKQKGPM
jgi:hypothetical protein